MKTINLSSYWNYTQYKSNQTSILTDEYKFLFNLLLYTKYIGGDSSCVVNQNQKEKIYIGGDSNCVVNQNQQEKFIINYEITESIFNILNIMIQDTLYDQLKQTLSDSTINYDFHNQTMYSLDHLIRDINIIKNAGYKNTKKKLYQNTNMRKYIDIILRERFKLFNKMCKDDSCKISDAGVEEIIKYIQITPQSITEILIDYINIIIYHEKSINTKNI